MLDLPRVTADPEDIQRQTAAELTAALARLRAVRRDYWERDWRREHRPPENELWDAVDNYLDLLDQAE